MPSSRLFLKRWQTDHPFWGTRSNDAGFDRGAGDPIAWTKRCLRCPHRAGFATASMSNQSPSKRAWSAVGALPMLTTCALRSHGRLAAKSAMSLPW